MSTTGTEWQGGTMPTDEVKLVLPSKSLSIGAGMSWISEGWRLFVKAPLMWIVGILIIFVLAIVANFIPIIGGLAFQVLNPVFAAGFVVAARSLERGGEFELDHLFAGFKKPFVNLLIVGLLLLGGWIVIMLIGAAVMGFGVIMAFMTGNSENMAPALAGSAMTFALGGLIILALMVPLMMAYWFAPALVVMHDMAPVASMKESFFGCLKNFFAFVIYGLLMGLLLIVALIPFGLGMLVWVPLAITSTYAAYRQIYTEGGTTAVTTTV